MGGRGAGGSGEGGRIAPAPGPAPAHGRAAGGGAGGDGEREKGVECPRCGAPMVDIQACHLLCTRCGANLDCSDKGTFW